MEIKVGVVGATGYAGAELVRLLLNHPYAKLTAISSVTFEGQKLSEVYPSYLGLCDMVCKNQEEVVEKCDGNTVYRFVLEKVHKPFTLGHHNCTPFCCFN